MSRFGLRLALLALVSVHNLLPFTVGVAQPAPVCYRADHPLGPDAASIRRHDTPGRLATFRTLDGGRVERPGMLGGLDWASRSRWERTGDSLRVRLSTGTAGWALRLVATPAGSDSTFMGEARYLSDARTAPTDTGWRYSAPVVRTVRVWREPCASPVQRGGGVDPNTTPRPAWP